MRRWKVLDWRTDFKISPHTHQIVTFGWRFGGCEEKLYFFFFLENEMRKMGVAASMIVYDADLMSLKGRKEVAKWMRRQAYLLEKYGKDLSGSYRARYMYSKRTYGRKDS